MEDLGLYILIAAAPLCLIILAYGSIKRQFLKAVKMVAGILFITIFSSSQLVGLYSLEESLTMSVVLSLLAYVSMIGWTKAYGQLEETKKTTMLSKEGKVKVALITIVAFVTFSLITIIVWQIKFSQMMGGATMISTAVFIFARKHYGIPVDKEKE